MKTRSLSVIQEISKETDGIEELCNRAEIILVCIGPKFTASHIPESLKESISRFQAAQVE
ncbi:hypothetical protein FIM25_02030 [Desulfobotulus mexicanus]|uniref:Uncharacterized protein n=1 Tax=Desulfobotulus mexicanus TaxID=2586642 RepID=A0A5Q4VH74_9BACT|nr:hypothetical protein FIM25_02030 [Desulfobotulus mexicanus]